MVDSEAQLSKHSCQSTQKEQIQSKTKPVNALKHVVWNVHQLVWWPTWVCHRKVAHLCLCWWLILWCTHTHTHALPVKQTHCLPMPITLCLMWSSDTWWTNYHCLCVYFLSSYNSYAFNRLSHSVAYTWAYFKMWVTSLINDQVQIAETLLGMLLVVCLYSHNRPHVWVIRPGVEHLHTVTDRGS